MKGALCVLLVLAASCEAIRSVRKTSRFDVYTAPVAVSLGEIMGKIEAHAPVDDIKSLVLDLQRKIEGDKATEAQQHTAYQRDSCNPSQLTNDISTATSTVTELQGKIRALNETNQFISDTLIPNNKTLVDEALELVAAIKANLTDFKAVRQQEAEAYLIKKQEIMQALDIIRTIRVFVQNSTLDDHAFTGLFEKSSLKKTTDLMVSQLESKAAAATGMRAHLMTAAAKTLASGGIEAIEALLYRMRNEYVDELSTQTSLERDRYITFYAKCTTLAKMISDALSGAQNAKEAQAQCLQDFAANGLTMATHAQSITDEQGKKMLWIIDLHRMTKECADEDRAYTIAVAKRDAELESISGLLAKLDNIEMPEWLATAVEGISATGMNSGANCYCDALCDQNNDCCEGCQYASVPEPQPTSGEPEPVPTISQ